MSIIVVTWGHNITRSSSLALKLNATDIHLKPIFKNKYLKLFNYIISSSRMLQILFKTRPSQVIVTLPPIFLLYIVFFYKLFRKVDVVADLHNGVLRREWANWPFVPYFLSKCKSVLSHNYQVQKKINDKFSLNSNSRVLTDPLKEYSFKPNCYSQFIFRDKINVLVPVSYAKDEPIKEIIEAAEYLGSAYNFILTGNYRKQFNDSYCEKSIVTFTGFIDYQEYENLLFLVDLTLCLTNDDDIQMCAVIESISADKNFICSNNTVNRELFSDYYFDVADCSAASITEKLINFKNKQGCVKNVNSKSKYNSFWQDCFNDAFES